MITKCLKAFLIFFASLSGLLLVNPTIQAQDNGEDMEVYLAFRHRGVVNSYVISYYKDDVFYLPVGEIFSLFNIEAQKNGLIISGRFAVEQIPYTINLGNQTIVFDGETYQLDQTDFLIKELDNYLPPRIFSDIFGLDFSIDFNNLALELETERELPSIAQALRAQRRQLADQNRGQITYFPLTEGRSPSFLNGGFMDYSLSSNVTPELKSVNYSSSLGLQLLGGDLQGSLFGALSNQFNSFSTNNFRWRYIIRDKPAISTVMLGQTQANGVIPSDYTGIRLSNEPVEPRRLFDEFEIQGNTFAESEVELYMNNLLVDFQKADALGNYRFLTPIYYGASQLDLRIYGPTGQIIERTSRLQIPFTFVPKGSLTYNLNAGLLDNPILGSTERSAIYQGNFAYGLSSWLTTKFGAEYYENKLGDSSPAFTSTISARLLQNHILRLEGVSSAYYRASLSAIYPNSASLSLDYINYTSESKIYNSSGYDNQVVGSLSHPFNVFSIPMSVRTSMFTRFRGSDNFSSFRFDLNSRFRKLNLRLGYTDRLVNTLNPLESSENALLETSLTYNFTRNPNIPVLLRGTFLRAQMRYFTNTATPQSGEFFFSRNVFKKGRLQFSVGRNFQGNYNTFRFNIVIDLDKLRSNSTVAVVNNSYTATQNFRGSVGYDTNYGNFLMTSRDQVGRSGAAVRMFVDNNGNNEFDDEDEQITEGSIRIGRSGATSIQKNGIQYYTIMQPYYRYNMEMNKASIKNPMLVPEVEQFSIITDPNTFKKIEIPFYQAGVMDGGVERVFPNGNRQGIGGLKLILSSKDGEFSKTLRTFSDGSFYEYPLPPNDYEVYVDPSQLELLQSVSRPAKIEFEVKATPQGDFIEGLQFTIIPESQIEEEPETETESLGLSDVTDSMKNAPQIRALENTLEQNVGSALKFLVQAQIEFYNHNIDEALELIDKSLNLYETAQGYALKGTLYYFKGNRSMAQRNWNMAVRFDPDIYIPDLELLDETIQTDSSEE